MEMSNIFERLKTLQDILAKKYEIESKIEEAPKTLNSQDELLVRLKKEYIEKNATYETSQAKIAQLKADLAEAVAAREAGEKGMDNITTHREYEALDKEIKDATDRETQVRKDLQREEKFFEELSANMLASEQLIATQQSEIDAGKASLEAMVSGLKQELEELKKQEEEIIPGIDPEIIFKFERIIRNKQSKGIVAVKGNVCDGCHMILPAQFANEVRQGKDIVFCPYCSRILFYQEQDKDEEIYFDMSEAGSLVDLEDEDTFDEELEEEDEDQDEVKELDYED